MPVINSTRQHPLVNEITDKGHQLFYIADFFCAEARLAVELDGPVHEQQSEYDLIRDRRLAERGIVTLRFANAELEDMEAVLEKIRVALAERVTTNTPSLRSREGAGG